jgi:AcrR family transcriptional regulator
MTTAAREPVRKGATRAKSTSRARNDEPARSRVDSAARREQLLDAAAHIVSAEGVSALTIESVVAKVGVHRPIVYRHFANADELLAAVIERELAALRAASAVSVEGVEGFEARVRAAVTSWMEHFARSPTLLSIGLVLPPMNRALRERRREQNDHSVGFFVREFEPEGLRGVDAELAAAALLHALTGIVALWARRQITRTVAIDRYVRIAVATLHALRDAPDVSVAEHSLDNLGAHRVRRARS